MSNLTTKQKLDFVFVSIGIITFTLTAILHIRTLRKGLKEDKKV